MTGMPDQAGMRAAGAAFVMDRCEEHGPKDAYDMAGAYLDMQESRGLGTTWRDAEEEPFCEGVREARETLRVRLDCIAASKNG